MSFGRADAVEKYGQDAVDRFQASVNAGKRMKLANEGYLYTTDENGIIRAVTYSDYLDDNRDSVAQESFCKSYSELTEADKKSVDSKLKKQFKNEQAGLKVKNQADIIKFTRELNEQIAKSPLTNKLTVKLAGIGKSTQFANYKDGVITLDPNSAYSVTAAQFYLSHELLHFMTDNILGNDAKVKFYDSMKELATSLGWNYDAWYNRIRNSKSYTKDWEANAKRKSYSKEKTEAYMNDIAEEETLARFISTALNYKQILSALEVESPDILNALEEGLSKTGVKNMINTQWDYARLKALKNIQDAKATPMSAEDVKGDVAKAMQSLEDDLDEYYGTAEDGSLVVRFGRRSPRNDGGRLQDVLEVIRGIQPPDDCAQYEIEPQTESAKRLVALCEQHGLPYNVVTEEYLKKENPKQSTTYAASYGDRFFIAGDLEFVSKNLECVFNHELSHIACNTGDPVYRELLSDFVVNSDVYFSSKKALYQAYRYYTWYVETKKNKERWSEYKDLDVALIEDKRLLDAADEMFATMVGNSYLNSEDIREVVDFDVYLVNYEQIVNKLVETVNNYDYNSTSSEVKAMQSLDEEDFTNTYQFEEYQKLRDQFGTTAEGLPKRLSPANIVGKFASSVLGLGDTNGRVILTNEETGDTQVFQNSTEAVAFLNDKSGGEEKYEPANLNSAFAKNNTLEGYKVSFPDGMLVDDLRKAVIQGAMRGQYSHFILTDESALQTALNRVRNHNTIGEAVTDFNELSKHGKGNLSKTDIAYGEQLLIELADTTNKLLNGELSQNEDTDPAKLYEMFEQVTADLCAAASRAGQNLQAFSMLKKLTPEGRLYYIQSQTNALISDMIDRKGNSRIGGYRYMNDGKGKYYYRLDKNGNYELVRGGTSTPVTVSQELVDKMLSCKTEAEMAVVEEEIIQEIASKIPTTITDRVVAWRYLAMLGNPRTHIRNIVSNYAMGLAVDTKNMLKGALEDAVLGNKTEGRTTTLKGDSEVRNALLDFADSDWEKDANDELTLNGGKQGYQSRLNDARNKLGIKNFDTLDKLAKLNNKALDKEDWNSAKRAFKKAFANYCEANKLTADYFSANIVNSNTRLAQARAYAINEAAKATYHDANEVATLLNKLEKSSPVAKLIVGGLVPFKKTPANILRRGLEYSPVGLVKGVTDWVKANNTIFEDSTWALDNADALSQTGTRAEGASPNATKLSNSAFERYSADAKKTYMIAKALDELASGLTGTMVMLIGALLAHWGLLKAGGDDNDTLEYYDEMTGSQEYSITIGGKNYTLDWLTPISMPLFTGAVLNKLGEGEGLEFSEILDAIGQIADPVMNLSVLQGINNAIDSYDSGLGKAVLAEGEGYVGQFIPTIFGQVARTIDPTRRTTYTAKEGESALGKDLGTFVNKIENKIPGLSFTNSAYVDQWGRQEVDQDPFILRLLKNSVFPWYERDVNKTAADDYITQVYQATGDTSVIPSSASTRFVFDNKTYYLMSDEYQATKELVGQLSYNGINSLVRTNGFADLTSDEQANVISEVYSYARKVAKKDYAASKGLEYTEDKSTTRINEAVNAGMSVGQAIYVNYMMNNMTADKDASGKTISGSKKKKVLNFLNSLGLTDKQIDAISIYDNE